METRFRAVWLPVLLLCWIAPGRTQNMAQQADGQGHAREEAEYRVGPGDLLSMRVFGLPQFDQSMRISNSGKIHVRYVGVLTVQGMTVGRIEEEVARELRERRLVNDPWVRIQVDEFHAQPIFVIGEVNVPGQLMVTGEMRLLDVISRAGGLKQTAGEEALLIRRRGLSPAVIGGFSQEGGTAQGQRSQAEGQVSAESPARSAEPVEDGSRIKINLAQLTEGSRPELNMRVQGGDIFYVPTMRQQVIYIIGEVKWPGAYILPRVYDDITATKALAYAGGVTRRTARSGKAFIVRYDKNGKIQPVPLDITATIKGKLPDIPVMPNDIIFVPRSVAKMTGYKILDMTAHLTHQFIIF